MLDDSKEMSALLKHSLFQKLILHWGQESILSNHNTIIYFKTNSWKQSKCWVQIFY